MLAVAIAGSPAFRAPSGRFNPSAASIIRPRLANLERPGERVARVALRSPTA